MNTKLTQLEAKLRRYRLGDSPPARESVLNEIYDTVLDQEIYDSLWDEAILLGIKELFQEDPPNEEVYGAAVRFLQDRQLRVSTINDVFYKIVDTAIQLKDAVAASAELLGIPLTHCKHLEADPGLVSLRGSLVPPSVKIEQFLHKLVSDSKLEELPNEVQQCGQPYGLASMLAPQTYS